MQHHALALRVQSRSFGQGLVNLRASVRCLAKEFLEGCILRFDLPAHFTTLREICKMKFRDSFEFGLIQIEFLLQPRQFGNLTPL